MRWLQRLFILTFWLELICGMLAGQIVTTPHVMLHEQVIIERDDPGVIVQANAKEKVIEADVAIAPLPDEPPVVPPHDALPWSALLEPPRLLALSIPQPRGPPAASLTLISLTPLIPRAPPALPCA